MADLRTQSPPLAIALERAVRANDPKATATYGHREPVASFRIFQVGHEIAIGRTVAATKHSVLSVPAPGPGYRRSPAFSLAIGYWLLAIGNFTV